jgi:hypothetical protein
MCEIIDEGNEEKIMTLNVTKCENDDDDLSHWMMMCVMISLEKMSLAWPGRPAGSPTKQALRGGVCGLAD